MEKTNMDNRQYSDAVKQIKQAILSSQYQAAKGANAVQLSLYYGIGKYVSENSRKGTWGTGAIAAISAQLQKELPGLRGFGEANIKFMRQFYESWKETMANSLTQVSELNECRENEPTNNLSIAVNSLTAFSEFVDIQEFLSLGFSLHMMIIRKTKTTEERLFYIHQAYSHQWSKYTLRDMLKADIFHHQGQLPNNFLNTMPDKQDALKAVSMFKDEYLLDFINIDDIDASDPQDVNERVVEQEIVHNIKKFIVNLGTSFCFIGNQYRVEVDDEEFFIDLLFYNRDLKALVAIELKRGTFKPSYLGQLNFYLNVLDSKERRDGENPSVGLLLCKDLNKSVVELAVRSYTSPMGVATYRLPADVPEEYKSLRPIMERAQQLLNAKDE